ncbi:MAG: M20/M25/M40 family metallo-hydrolase [Acidobacteria bacterium]|nr:M20/M25/M40 family metallo-hydrolase [Acidobacteriota bacterium]
MRELLVDPQVQAALAFAQTNEPRVLEYQIQLTEIPAPPFQEQARGRAYAQMFRERGLTGVRTDDVGNVLGMRPGRNPSPLLVLSAHLDTVFPEGTDVTVKRDGDRLSAPGIGDDGRGLAVVLGVLDALNHAKVETAGSILFVGTVGEEGLGDLRGVKHLFQKELPGKIDRFISVDGVRASIVNVGVGSYRYRVTYSGPGGHSYGSFGMTSPIHALGRLSASIAEFETAPGPKTTFSVGRIGGGTSVNSIAHDAWLEVDMRSQDKDALETLHAKFQTAAAKALAAERARWQDRAPLEASLDQVGYRPAGQTPEDSPAVQAAIVATQALELDPEMHEGSTDANIGMSLGVPAITIGGGGHGQGAHSPSESFDADESYKGVQRALLVALALSGDLE